MRWSWWLIALLVTGCEPMFVIEPVRPPVDAGPSVCPLVQASLDFGEQEHGSQTDRVVSVENPNLFTAELAFAAVDAPFFVSGGLTQNTVFVPPRGFGSLSVTFAPRDARLAIADLIVTPRFPFDCPPTTVRLSGLGAGELSVPDQVDFPPAALGGTSAALITLVNSRRVAMAVDVRTDAPQFDAGFDVGSFTAPDHVVVPALSTFDVPMQFTANTSGFQRGVVTFVPVIGVPKFTLVTAISGMPHAEQHRTRLAIDPLPTSMNVSRSLLVRNVGTGLLRLSNLRVVAGAGAQPDELRARMVSLSDVEVGGTATLALDFAPAHEGPAQWTVLVDTNEAGQPTLSWDVRANLAPTATCLSPVENDQLSLTVPGPYPMPYDLTFTNATAQPCLVTAMGFTTFTPWTIDLADNDSFVVPANGQVQRRVTFTQPGATQLQWVTHGTNVRVLTLIAN